MIPAWYCGDILDFISEHPIRIIEDYPICNSHYYVIDALFNRMDLKLLNFMQVSLQAITVVALHSLRHRGDIQPPTIGTHRK
jgi:hypothetical protein